MEITKNSPSQQSCHTDSYTPHNSSELGLLLPASGLNPRVFKNFRPLCPLGALFRSPSLCFQPFAASFPKTRGGGTLWRSNVQMRSSTRMYLRDGQTDLQTFRQEVMTRGGRCSRSWS